MPDNKNKLAVEIIEPENFRSVISHMPNPMAVFFDKGSLHDTVEQMLSDAKIGSLLRIRKDIVTSFPFIVEQSNASDEVYKFVKDNLFENLNFENDVKELLSAIEHGFAFSEILWKKNKDGYYVPDSLRQKKPNQIVFKTDFVLVPGGRKSIWVPVLLKDNTPLNANYKFLVYRNNPKAENPYGTSDLFMCYWPWKFKQLGWEFWAEAAHKAGVPSLAALFDAPSEEKAKKSAQEISKTLEEMEGGSGVAFANVKDLKVLSMSGALADHKVLIETCNQEISFALTTQSLSTQEGEYGTRAQATVHDENMVRSAHGDAKALSATFQQLIDWMVEINFGKDVPTPKGEFDLESYASFDEVMKAIEKKIPISKDKLYNRYGLPKPKDDEDTFLMPESSQPSSIDLSDSSPGKKKLRKTIEII